VAHPDEATGPWRPDGFPPPLRTRRRAAAWWPPAAAAAAVLTLLVLLGMAVRPAQRPVVADAVAAPAAEVLGPPSEQVAAPPATTRAPAKGTTKATPAPTTAPVAQPSTGGTTTAAATTRPAATRTTARPSTRPPSTPPTTRPPTTPPAPKPTVTVGSAFVREACPTVWHAQLTATVTGARATSVEATWTVNGTSTLAPMTEDPGGAWVAAAGDLPPGVDIPWSVTATVGGTKVTSSTATLRYDCPPG
jgi:hypothetical protein